MSPSLSNILYNVFHARANTKDIMQVATLYNVYKNRGTYIGLKRSVKVWCERSVIVRKVYDLFYVPVPSSFRGLVKFPYLKPYNQSVL